MPKAKILLAAAGAAGWKPGDTVDTVRQALDDEPPAIPGAGTGFGL